MSLFFTLSESTWHVPRSTRNNAIYKNFYRRPDRKTTRQFSSITNRIWATVLKGTPLRLAGLHPRTAMS